MEEIKQEIQKLNARLDKFESSSTIPLNVDHAFTARLGPNFAKVFTTLKSQSTKNASTETRAVNESGSSSYNVAKPPAGFFLFTVGATDYYIPYYTL